MKAREEHKVGNFMIDAIMINEIIKIGTDKIVVTEKISIEKIEVNQGMNKIIGDKILEVTPEHTKYLEDRIVEGNIEVTIGKKIIGEKEVEVGLENNHF